MFIARGGPWTLAQGILSLGALLVGIASGQFGGVRLLAAVPMVLVGAGFGIRGVLDLGASRSVLPEPRTSGGLVRTGVYGKVRHPLYASQFWLGAAWILGTGSIQAALWVAGLAVVLVFKARDEERRLVLRFPEYAAYRREIPAFLPRFR